MLKRIVVLSLLGIFGCWLLVGSLRAENGDMPKPAAKDVQQVPDADPPILGRPDLIEPSPKKIVDPINAFGFSLFKELAKEEKDKNLFISPFSISAALTMTYNGAKENTLKEMEKTLGYEGIKNQDVNTSFQALNARLNGFGKSVEFSVANSIWIRKGLSVLPEFIKQNQESFKAEIQTREFDEATRKEINDWIAKQTKDKIKDMLKKIDANNVMFLINAIYFKGTWFSTFDPKNTREQEFWIAQDKSVKTSIMHQTANFKYLDDKDFQAVVLPYTTGEDKSKSELAMYIFLPKEKDGLDAFLKNFSHDNFNKWLKAFLAKRVAIALPKFKIEYGVKDLKDNLITLGIKDAFSPGEADLSGIGDGGLFISKVLHKAFVDVNESGTEAAAATIVIISKQAAKPKPPVEFTADHPFVFLIRDEVSGAILFMGVLNNPSGK